MKILLFKTLVCGCALSAVCARAALDFSNLNGSSIEFLGASHEFEFTDGSSSAYQWKITTPGSAEGFLGEFNGGPWSYGQVISLGPVQITDITAPLGDLVISDGAGYYATGSVNWGQMDTFYSIGGINAQAVVNLTGLTYGGNNADLRALVAGNSGSVDISFQFNPAESLTQLSTGSGPYLTSYSGSLTGASLPEPGTWLAGALPLLALAPGALRAMRKLRA